MLARRRSISACMCARAASASAVSDAIVASLAANSAWYSSAALRTCASVDMPHDHQVASLRLRGGRPSSTGCITPHRREHLWA